MINYWIYTSTISTSVFVVNLNMVTSMCKCLDWSKAWDIPRRGVERYHVLYYFRTWFLPSSQDLTAMDSDLADKILVIVKLWKLQGNRGNVGFTGYACDIPTVVDDLEISSQRGRSPQGCKDKFWKDNKLSSHHKIMFLGLSLLPCLFPFNTNMHS